MIACVAAAALMMSGAIAPPAPDEAVRVAKTWVKMTDAQEWHESWNSAGTFLKSRVPQSQFSSGIASVRVPLGAVQSRTVKALKKATSLPGMPDGNYEIVQFQTKFAHKADAVETVVLGLQSAGWKVDGYFIR